jgi:hypothetical protein
LPATHEFYGCISGTINMILSILWGGSFSHLVTWSVWGCLSWLQSPGKIELYCGASVDKRQPCEIVTSPIMLLEPTTERSRRMIVLPDFVVESLRGHLARREKLTQSPKWKESGLVFTTDVGTPIAPRNKLRHF